MPWKNSCFKYRLHSCNRNSAVTISQLMQIVIYHAFSHLQVRQIHITQLLQSTAVKDTQLPQIQSCYRCTAATDTQLIQIHSCYRYPTDTDTQLLQKPSCYRCTATTDTYVAATEHSCYRYTATDTHLPQIHSSYRYSTQLLHIHSYRGRSCKIKIRQQHDVATINV